MSCAFDLDHYRELLEAAAAGGYHWARFDPSPRWATSFSATTSTCRSRLRCDGAARARARRARDVLPHAGERLLQPRLAPGRDASPSSATSVTRSALHAVYPRASRDERFDAVVAWHNPDPGYVHEPVERFVNVMQAPWFTKGKYRSDSNQHWREAARTRSCARGDFEWLQLLVHPEIWVYPGATMGDTMRAMLDAKRERAARHLAGDRIDHVMTTILV